MRALVTGASGFIGSHVALALAGAGAEIRAFDRKPPVDGQLPGGAEFIQGDVLEPESVRHAADGCDAIFHLAAVYSYARADADRMQTINVRGTRTVLDAAGRGSRPRVVHTSSCATCGPVRGRRANERDAPEPSQLGVPYRRTKLEGERLALAAAREGLDVIVVNPTVPVGPGDLRPTPTGKMVADVALGRARAYLANSALNIVAVEDVAIGHLLAFERGRCGERYLLGGEDMSIREIFAVIAAAVGRSAPRVGLPWLTVYAAARIADTALAPFGREPRMLLLDEVRAGRLPHVFDDSKARAELGYSSRPAADALAAAARHATVRSGSIPR
jgi:dihydroflavonol-4-reductase